MSNCPPMVDLTPISTLSKSMKTAMRVVRGSVRAMKRPPARGAGHVLGRRLYAGGTPTQWLIASLEASGTRSSKKSMRFPQHFHERVRPKPTQALYRDPG